MSEATVRLTVAQALVRYLCVQYTERDGQHHRAIPAIVGIFGHGNLALNQAIAQEGLNLLQPKNEQSGVHLALGYAKASRRLQTLAVTASIGPGSTNMLTGAATATTNRLPVLLLPSDTFANRRQGPVLQQLEHPTEADTTVNDAYRPLSRFFDRIARPEQLLTALPEAMRVLFDPAEAGAVAICVHQDVQGEAYDYPGSFFCERTWTITRRPPARNELDAASELIRASQRPVIIAGGGVRYSDAQAVLQALSETAGIPVLETSAGKGTLTDSEWLIGGVGVNGNPAANELARDADLVICAGTRLSDFTTGSHSLFQHPKVRFIAINTNAADAHKLSATPIVADARETLEQLQEQLGSSYRTPDHYQAAVQTLREKWTDQLDEHIRTASESELLAQACVLRTLNEHLEPGDWVVAAAGYQPGDVLKMWQTPPRTHTHIEFAYSCMGHEIPAGLGIRLRERDRGDVFVLVGDGTYLMAPSELVTAVQEGLKITVLLLDNGGYQSIHGLASGSMGVSVGNEFRSRDGNHAPDGPVVSIDYAGNARSMGAAATTVETVRGLKRALAQARAHKRASVIVCRTMPQLALPPGEVWWDLGVPEVAKEAKVGRHARAVLEGRAAQRSY